MPNTLIWIIITAALVAAADVCARLYIRSSADEEDSSAPAEASDADFEPSDSFADPDVAATPDDDFIIDEALAPEDFDDSDAVDPDDGDFAPADSLDPISEDPAETDDIPEATDAPADTDVTAFDDTVYPEDDTSIHDDFISEDIIPDEADGEDSDEDCAMTGLNWSQTASYVEGCFSFSITPDKDCHRLSGFACGKKGRMTDFDSVKLRDSDWNEIESLLDASDVEEWCLPDDDTVPALDETTTVFELVFADLSSIRVFPPDNGTCDKIREILLKAAGIR